MHTGFSSAKATRLFPRAAVKVNERHSKVPFQDARVNARMRMQVLWPGSESEGSPAKWYTTGIRHEYESVYKHWQTLQDTLPDNLKTVDVSSTRLIGDAASESDCCTSRR